LVERWPIRGGQARLLWIGAERAAATWLNAEKMARYRDEMRKYYYDPSKYDT